MQDRDLVARIVAGDPEALATAYDRYGPALYTYCRSMLHDADEAADALQDTFVVAARKLEGLRDRDRLRPWLYAVARNECLRRLRARARDVDLDQAGEVSDDSVDLEAGVRQAEIRDLVRSAFGGLNPGDREVLELSLRHELDGADLGAALGVSANHAHALLSRARTQLETSLGALLVARTGRQECPELAALLEGWDGELTVLMRKRVNRHIEHCDICGERRKLLLRPEALLGALPILLLPPHLRSRLMRLVSDTLPEAAAYRDDVARRAEPFNRAGFPVPVQRPRRPVPVGWPGGGTGGGTRNKAIVMSVVVLLLLAVFSVGTALAMHMLTPSAAVSPTTAPPPQPVAPSTTYVITISESPSQSSPQITITSASPSPSPSTSKASPSPSRSPSASPSRSPSPPPPPPPILLANPVFVTATWSPTEIVYYAGSFTLSASGGTVATFSITAPDLQIYGQPSVSPSTGGPVQVGKPVQIGVYLLANSPSPIPFTMTVKGPANSVTVTVSPSSPPPIP
jgi:RNA polymerase sigma factor (sigma-70 family)